MAWCTLRGFHGLRIQHQKRHQVWILVPIGRIRRLHLGRHFTACQCLSLHVEIDFGVDVRRIQRDMTKPCPDRIDIDPSSQQMDRCRVANRVWANGLGA